jgi:hypothetical protein
MDKAGSGQDGTTQTRLQHFTDEQLAQNRFFSHFYPKNGVFCIQIEILALNLRRDFKHINLLITIEI